MDQHDGMIFKKPIIEKIFLYKPAILRIIAFFKNVDAICKIKDNLTPGDPISEAALNVLTTVCNNKEKVKDDIVEIDALVKKLQAIIIAYEGGGDPPPPRCDGFYPMGENQG